MKVELVIESGKTKEPVNQYLKKQDGNLYPFIKFLFKWFMGKFYTLIYWVEPRSGIVKGIDELEPILNFKGITESPPDWNIEMDEGRLFWKNGMLHVVALPEGGCRWFKCYEKPKKHKSITSKNCDRIEYIILLRRDWERFGKQSDDLELKRVKIIEYRENSRLIAWRMLPIKTKTPSSENHS